jgi:hypothetical protein
VIDKLEEDGDMMEIDEGDPKTKLRIQTIYDLKKAQALLKEFTENPNVYADSKLSSYVRDKVTYIEKLKSSLDKMTTEEHNFGKLREYLKFMQEVENVDFSYEIARVKEKIEILE